MKRSRGEGSIYKDNRGRWVVAVSCGYDPITGKRKRIVRVAKSQREAIVIKKSLIEQGQKAKNKKITVGEWLNEYFDVFVGGEKIIAKETASKYKHYCIKISQLCSGGDLSTFSRTDIQRVINKIIGTYSAGTARGYVAFFLRALREAEEEGLIKPFGNIKTKIHIAPRKPKELNADEWKALLTSAKKFEATSASIVILLAMLAGLRRGEIAALEWHDISFDKSIIHIHAAVHGELYKDRLIGKTKTGGNRDVAMNSILSGVLAEWKKSQKKILLAFGWTAKYQNTVVHGVGGKPVSKSYLSILFRKCAKIAGLDIKLHDLRHYYATMLIAAGVNIKAAQAALGHSRASTTLDIYADCDSSWIDEIKAASPPMALLSALQKK